MKWATLIQFDIETLSLHPTNAVVGEIGIHVDHLFLDTEDKVRVGSDGLISVLLDMKEQQTSGRLLDIDTIQWWLKQNEIARSVMADPHDRKHVFDAIQTVDTFVRKHMDIAEVKGSKVFILSSAPAFDMTNVRSLYEAAGMEHPWQHWQEHSQRTLRKLCNPETIPPRSAEEFLHGGASDAEYQNKVLVAQMNSSDAGAIALQQFFFGG